MNTALTGRRIVNTRAVHQAAEFDALLRDRGAEPVSYPCIAIAPPQDSAPLDAALHVLAEGGFEWLLVTSANTVYALRQRLDALGLDLSGAEFQTAAVGPATAQAVEDALGLTVDHLPDEFVAESLAASLPVAAGERVFLPESEIARPALYDGLTARGATVTVVTAYRTVIGEGGADLPRLLAEGCIDAITFTSSSTVTHCIDRLQAAGSSPDALRGVCIAVIGPRTADTAQAHGLTIDVLPEEYTLEGMVAGLELYFS